MRQGQAGFLLHHYIVLRRCRESNLRLLRVFKRGWRYGMLGEEGERHAHELGINGHDAYQCRAHCSQPQGIAGESDREG